MIEIELKRIADALEALVAHTIAPRAVPAPPVAPLEGPAASNAVAEIPAAVEAPKRGRGRPPKPTEPEVSAAPAAPVAAEEEDFLAEEQKAPTKDDVLQALLAAKARRSAALAKSGTEKTAAEAQAHREIGELLKTSAGVATLTALPTEKYAAVIAAAAAV